MLVLSSGRSLVSAVDSQFPRSDGRVKSVDIVKEVAPSVWPGHETPIGFPLGDKEKVYKVGYSKAKQERLLGLRFRTKEETTKDILKDFAKRRW